MSLEVPATVRAMSMELPPEEEFLAAAKIDLEAEYVKDAFAFLREQLTEAMKKRHMTAEAAAELFDTVHRKFGTVLQISAHYIPLPSERAHIAHALWTILFAAYSAGAQNTRYLHEAQTSHAERMRRAKAEKGKYDQRRDIVREEAQKAIEREPALKEVRQNSALARKIHPVVNDRLRAIFRGSNPKAEFMNVEAIRKQLENL